MSIYFRNDFRKEFKAANPDNKSVATVCAFLYALHSIFSPFIPPNFFFHLLLC